MCFLVSWNGSSKIQTGCHNQLSSWWCFYLDENNFVMVYIILISILICGATLFPWYSFEKPFPLWLNTVPWVGFICFSPIYLCSALKCAQCFLLWHKRWWRPKVDTCCLQQPCAVRVKTAVSAQSHWELHISRGVWRPSVTVFRSQIIGWTGFWLGHFKDGQIWYNLKNLHV